MLSIKPKINVLATILAKNEDDIIAQMIEHTIEQGVSQIIFTDNASTDKTKEIVSRYPEVVEIIDEPGDDHNQTKWVTHMARLACKFKPDWIIHLDADELWCGIQNLRRFDTAIVGCEKMYLHPPVDRKFDLKKQRFYLDFDHLPIPQECKVAHRPMENVIITHGNHGVSEPNTSYTSTQKVYRHHYPIRSYDQWERKSKGHEALDRRGSYCKRWSKWYDLFLEPSGHPWPPAEDIWQGLTKLWSKITLDGNVNHDDFLALISVWVEEEMLEFFKNNPDMIAKIGEWPR